MSNLIKHDYKTWVEVSGSALENNTQVIKKLLKPSTKLMAVVKSNAYGHGLPKTANLFLKYGIDWLGVDNIDEAILLRGSNIKAPILVMGYTPASRFKEAAQRNIRITIYDPSLLRDRLVLGSKLIVHLKIDTGMSRQGVLVSDLPVFLGSLPSSINIEGVFTHFANADNLDDRSFPNLQFANFRQALQIIHGYGITPRIIHASATTGLLTMPEAHFDMVRVGIALYGLWPSLEFAKKFEKLGLKPVLSWKTRIAQIKDIKKGSYVGYGITEKVKKDSRIAVLPVGYYDGYARGLSSIGEVLIGGRRCKILGRISMNLTVADISKVINPRVWDEVVLIGRQDGEQIIPEELAQKIGTISYEVVCRINPLLPRIYIN